MEITGDSDRPTRHVTRVEAHLSSVSYDGAFSEVLPTGEATGTCTCGQFQETASTSLVREWANEHYMSHLPQKVTYPSGEHLCVAHGLTRCPRCPA